MLPRLSGCPMPLVWEEEEKATASPSDSTSAMALLGILRIVPSPVSCGFGVVDSSASNWVRVRTYRHLHTYIRSIHAAKVCTRMYPVPTYKGRYHMPAMYTE